MHGLVLPVFYVLEISEVDAFVHHSIKGQVMEQRQAAWGIEKKEHSMVQRCVSLGAVLFPQL